MTLRRKKKVLAAFPADRRAPSATFKRVVIGLAVGLVFAGMRRRARRLESLRASESPTAATGQESSEPDGASASRAGTPEGRNFGLVPPQDTDAEPTTQAGPRIDVTKPPQYASLPTDRVSSYGVGPKVLGGSPRESAEAQTDDPGKHTLGVPRRRELSEVHLPEADVTTDTDDGTGTRQTAQDKVASNPRNADDDA